MLQRSAVPSPLARSDGLLVEQVGAETVIFDTESGQAHCLSPVAAAVFEGADGRTGSKDLAAHARSATGEQVDEAQVEMAVAQLEERGLLVGPPTGISRRQLVRRTAAATAAVSAVPMITSIVTPAFGQGGTPVDRRCPGATCASQSEGDAFCACVNECGCAPPIDPGDCDADAIRDCTVISQAGNCPSGHVFENLGAPKLDSCECLGPDELRKLGMTPPTPVQCPSCSSPTNPGPGGCTDGSKFLDGRCIRLAGDTTEPCPAP